MVAVSRESSRLIKTSSINSFRCLLMRARLKALWNRLRHLRKRVEAGRKLNLGLTVCDGEVSRRSFEIAQGRRTEQIAVLGKTGSGKSHLLRSLCGQDIIGDRGFVFFDLH